MAQLAPHLVDEILEEIFLRLPTPTALARASTACVSFRLIITARSFLRRYHALHPPPLLRFATEEGFRPAQDPHPSAPLARALVDGADFSYSYVPRPDYGGVFTPWCPRDVRDGRVLLVCNRWFRRGPMTISRSVLAVCDPLSRRYLLLPPIPRDMSPHPYQEHLHRFEPILAPTGDDEDEASFRVVCWADYESKFVMFVFSSATGKWCVAASSSWSSFGTVKTFWESLSYFNYFCGRLYWTAPWGNKLLFLDTVRMEFSTVDILNTSHMQLIDQPEQSGCMSSIVVATEGAIEMFTLVEDLSPNGSCYLYHTTQQNNGHSSNKCQLKIVITLPHGLHYYIVGATEKFLFLRGEQAQCDDDLRRYEDIFSLDIKTSELKKVHGGAACTINAAMPVYPYFGFPPSLSKPTL